MLEFILPLGIFLLGLLTGFVDSTAGSGGLILIPMLIFMGVPPQAAIALDRFGTLGMEVGAFITFHKAKKIVWEFVPLFSLLALVGGIIGANILVSIDPASIQKIIGVILLLSLPLILLHKNAGVKRVATSVTRKVIGYFMYFVIMIYNGFFGTGAGPLTTYNQTLLFGLTIIESNATAIIPWFLLSVSSVIIFSQHNLINYTNAISLVIGMLLGGYVGAHTLLKIGDVWVKRLFIGVVLISGIKLLFF